MTKTLKQEDLAQFTGSENWYRHGLMRSITYTDGARYVAETGGAYWLLDIIATSQLKRKVAAEEFQVWTLTVDGTKGYITCEDGNGNKVYSQKIEFTDFPLPAIKFYYRNKVIMLPSEY